MLNSFLGITETDAPELVLAVGLVHITDLMIDRIDVMGNVTRDLHLGRVPIIEIHDDPGRQFAVLENLWIINCFIFYYITLLVDPDYPFIETLGCCEFL